MNQKRIQKLNNYSFDNTKTGPIVYWMSRDQRVEDNWALIFAQELALKKKSPLLVIFCVVPSFLSATQRQYFFMLEGLREVHKKLQAKNIGFIIQTGCPTIIISATVKQLKAGALIIDFDPLKIKQGWKEKILKKINCPCFEVDAHNIVPCRMVSQKQEYAAFTIRPKIEKLLPEFLDVFNSIKKHPHPFTSPSINWEKLKEKICGSKNQNYPINPGSRAAKKNLKLFITTKLKDYAENRNDPNKNGTSRISAYLHFGQISSQRVALEIMKFKGHEKSKSAFLEELIIRKELSDNFCFYNKNYDNFRGFPEWAQKTLTKHINDKRPYIYSRKILEKGKTHDPLWNAAQHEMVITGRMPGYIRMYWAKKILEWTDTPQTALRYAIYLNDKYELDGRDPNGYAGIAWAIGGMHDRPWPERPIFGTVRFMSYKGCESKFDTKKYIETI